MMNRRFVLTLLGSAVLASSACTINLDGEGVLVREQRRFTVSGSPELTLNTYDGSIDVRSWDSNEVLIEIEKRAANEEDAQALVITATQEGNRITVEAPQPRTERQFFGFNNSGVSIRVSVPRKLTLHAETGDGSIRAADLDGTIDLRSGDGSIAVDGITGHLTVNTGDGSVRAIDLSGNVALSSGDGSITARGRFASLRASSGDGSLNLEVEDGSTMEADWEATTGDGPIAFRVPPDFNAELDAESADGPINANVATLRGVAEPGGDRDDRQRLQARLGTGGRTLRLRSGDGPIRITN